MIVKLHVVRLHQVLMLIHLVVLFFFFSVVLTFFFSFLSFHKKIQFNSQIESQKLTESEVMAIVMYTYDITTMGSQHENFYFQLNEILRRRNVNLFSFSFQFKTKKTTTGRGNGSNQRVLVLCIKCSEETS